MTKIKKIDEELLSISKTKSYIFEVETEKGKIELEVVKSTHSDDFDEEITFYYKNLEKIETELEELLGEKSEEIIENIKNKLN